MCTVFFIRSAGLLSKNRDKETPEPEEVVHAPGMIGVRTAGTDYFSLAMNRHGLCFVSTAVNSPEWTRAVEEGRTAEAARQLQEERRGLTGPTRILSSAFADLRSVAEAVDHLGRAAVPWAGYHVVLVDAADAVLIEHFRDRTHSRPLAGRDAVTNHFHTLMHGARNQAEYPSSFDRLGYARERLPGIDDLVDLKEAANPTDPTQSARIWRDGAFSTVSATILDLGGRCLWRSTGRGATWTRHGLDGDA
jgi:hypothetical protein